MIINKKPQLFLLHFAGGNRYSFDFLKSYIGNHFDFHSLELPGRGRRFDEDLVKSKDLAIQDYVNQIRNKRNKQPYIIYGHSMGATLGLSVTKQLESSLDAPLQLIVSGNSGPGADGVIDEKEKKIRYLMNDKELKQELRILGGVPEEVLQNDELFDFFSPIIRADFEVLEKNYFLEENLKIDIPIFAMMGTREEKHDKIENWKTFTSSGLGYKILEGGHFFIHDHCKEIAEIINSCCEKEILV